MSTRYAADAYVGLPVCPSYRSTSKLNGIFAQQRTRVARKWMKRTTRWRTHRRMVARRGILRNRGRNNNSPASGLRLLASIIRKCTPPHPSPKNPLPQANFSAQRLHFSRPALPEKSETQPRRIRALPGPFDSFRQRPIVEVDSYLYAQPQKEKPSV